MITTPTVSGKPGQAPTGLSCDLYPLIGSHSTWTDPRGPVTGPRVQEVAALRWSHPAFWHALGALPYPACRRDAGDLGMRPYPRLHRGLPGAWFATTSGRAADSQPEPR
jgi:hypothetical protein